MSIIIEALATAAKARGFSLSGTTALILLITAIGFVIGGCIFGLLSGKSARGFFIVAVACGILALIIAVLGSLIGF